MIRIANKLEIKAGNVIQVPGCEATSTITSFTLSTNLDCENTVVKLEDALAAIPGSRIETLPNSGVPVVKYFVLPDGPPREHGCSAFEDCDDWYQVLREIGFQQEQDEDSKCEGKDSFSYFSGPIK